MGTQLSEKRRSQAPPLQKFFSWLFGFVLPIDKFRTDWPVGFSLICSGAIVVLMWQLARFLPITPNPDWWKWSDQYWTFHRTQLTLVSFLASFFLTQPLARGLLPLLIYVPQALAMKNLGLLYVTTDPKHASKLFEKAALEHSPKEKVKVICISGRYLFREQRLPEGFPSPLKKFAQEQMLDVVMPTSDPNNLTVRERFKTYDEQFRETQAILAVDDLVRETNQGKRYLLDKHNEVHEHDILCMWRVVIFSDHVLVQNYFPNKDQAHSYLAPLFMYSKKADGYDPRSYYEAYTVMFDLVKAGAARLESVKK